MELQYRGVTIARGQLLGVESSPVYDADGGLLYVLVVVKLAGTVDFDSPGGE